MGKGCSVEGCNGVHYAKGTCRYHYVMPSRKKSLVAPIINAIDEMNIALLKQKKKEPGVKELLKLLEIVFNRWIRHRDRLNDNTFKYISCGLFKPLRDLQAGHFFSKTFSALRFHEDNVHGECVSCNCHDDKHLIGYEVNLKEKIGLDRFNWLKENYRGGKKWDKQELLGLISKYK